MNFLKQKRTNCLDCLTASNFRFVNHSNASSMANTTKHEMSWTNSRRIKDAENKIKKSNHFELRKRKEELDQLVIGIDDTIDSLNREIGGFTNEKTQKKTLQRTFGSWMYRKRTKRKDADRTKKRNNKGHLANSKQKKKNLTKNKFWKGLETLDAKDLSKSWS